MTNTDSPLKQLVNTFAADFAAWLLGAEVQEAYALPAELPAREIFADDVFRVALTNGQKLILHIEF